MEIKVYDPSEQIDPAVDLGVLQRPLPEILDVEELYNRRKLAPPQIIEGIVHQGSKMILGGTSKSYKSWCLLDLAVSVASGQPWWGRRTTKTKVLYINFELPEWAVLERVSVLAGARPECTGIKGYLKVWNLRGYGADVSLLRPRLEEQLRDGGYGMIIIDPVYKLLGDRDENANGEIATLMNELEALARSTGAAIVLAHHFAKGDSTAKSAMDRMSGAGVWARDPDSILVLTPHEEENCFTVSTILRNLPQLDEFVVEWAYPLMRLAKDLNPDALRRPQGKNKVCTDREFVDGVLGDKALATKAVRERAREIFGMSPRTADRYLARNLAAGVICHGGGLYWAAKQEVRTQ